MFRVLATLRGWCFCVHFYLRHYGAGMCAKSKNWSLFFLFKYRSKMPAILKVRVQMAASRTTASGRAYCGEHILNPRTSTRPRWYSTLASVLFFGQGGRTHELSRRLNLIINVFSFQAALEAWVIFKRQAFDRWGLTIEQWGMGAGQHSHWSCDGVRLR